MPTKTARMPAIDDRGRSCHLIRSTDDLRGTLLGPNPEVEEEEATYRTETGEKLNRTGDPKKFISKSGQTYTLT